jgi:maleylpyruvate isomerase
VGTNGSDLASSLETLAKATDQLLDTVRSLTDEEVAGPSLLPGWTRGHVLTHLARHADSYTRALRGARTGGDTSRYPSTEVRDAEIEAGAGRSAAELAEDVRVSAETLAEVLQTLPAEAWQVEVERLPGVPGHPAAGTPWARLKELVIHHVDLDAGYSPAHWPAEFVAPCLEQVVHDFDGREDFPPLSLHAEDTDRRFTVRGGTAAAGAPTVSGPEPALLAWLIGRSTGDGLDVEPDGPLPAVPAWR